MTGYAAKPVAGTCRPYSLFKGFYNDFTPPGTGFDRIRPMKAKPHTVASILLLAGFSISMSEETRIQPQIESVGLFKNGVAVVRAAFTVPGPGGYRWEDIPQTIHGTFEVSGDPALTVRATRRMVEEDFTTSQPGMREELAGKSVTVTLDGGPGEAAATLQGRVMDAPAILSKPEFSTRYPENNPYGRYYGWNGPDIFERAAQFPQTEGFLVLETAAGREYVSRQHVRSISAEGPFGPVKRRVEKPVMVFDVTSGKGKIHIAYLARGMAWLPAYTVDTSDPAKLSIRQSAVVRNELMDVSGTALDLISGYPNIKFSHVDSPLNPETPLATFFQQLNSTGNSSPSTMSQMVSFNAMSPAATSALPENPESGQVGSDIHYQSVGKHDLQRGDSLSLTVASGSSPYTRIVEWIVPDSRDPGGHRNNNRENPDLPNPEDQPWDALQFTNPFRFPMTTAPASIIESGKFRGQSLSQWVNPGQTATLRVTQALSIRAQAGEIEEPNSRTNPKPENVSHFLGSRHLRLTIHGTLRMHNFRSTEVPMVIRCRFSGELVKADAEPTTTLLNEGNGINPRSELGWKIPLKPGEEKSLAYSYHLWIPY